MDSLQLKQWLKGNIPIALKNWNVQRGGLPYAFEIVKTPQTVWPKSCLEVTDQENKTSINKNEPYPKKNKFAFVLRYSIYIDSNDLFSNKAQSIPAPLSVGRFAKAFRVFFSVCHPSQFRAGLRPIHHGTNSPISLSPPSNPFKSHKKQSAPEPKALRGFGPLWLQGDRKPSSR